MNAEIWAQAKSLYLEATEAADGYEAYLERKTGIDMEVVALVREMLDEDEQPGPVLTQACWVSTKPEKFGRSFEVGQTLLGRFEIVGFLGSGGAGEVYRAYDRQQDIFVALKTVLPSLATDETALDMLRNEVNTARLVTSPHVCRLYDFHVVVDSGIPPFVTMELLEGETLASYLGREGPMKPEAAFALAKQMIAALEAAHSRGVVHRDFKPANVMLTDGARRVVVMDFGLAREFVPGASLQTTLASEMFAGTPAYMSPEQLRGQRATTASDLHALGVVLFEMVSGRRPFEGGGPLEIASKRLNENAPSPRVYVAGLDRRWERAILRCLEADRNRRPADGAAVLELLSEQPPLLWNRRKALISVGTAIPMLAGGGFWWRKAQSERVVTVDIFDVENRTGDANFDFLCQGTTGELIRRLTESDHISAIPIRGTLRAAGGRSKGEYGLSGVLSKDKGGERLDVQILDRHTEKQMWFKSYGSALFGDLLHLQEKIANEARIELVKNAGMSLRDLLGGGQHGASPTNSAAAFDLYIRGTSLQQEYTEESARAAIGAFERAVQLDPHFSLAQAALAECQISLLNYRSTFDDTLVASARESAQRAIREDPSLPEAHATMGEIHQVDWDWPAAEAEYDRALRSKPNFAKAMRWRAGLVLQFARFDEAIGALEKAFKIDPYDRGAISTWAMALIYAKRYGEAITMMEREIGDRDMMSARINLALANALLAQHSDGTASAALYAKAFEQARRVALIEKGLAGGASERSDHLNALLYSMRGELNLAGPFVKRLEENVNKRQSSPGPLAFVYAAQRRFDEALTGLERATMLRDRSVLYLRVSPQLEELRGTARFEALLTKLRLK